MNFWILAAGSSQLEVVKNAKIYKTIIHVTNSLNDDIKTKQLKWYEDVGKMSEDQNGYHHQSIEGETRKTLGIKCR